MFEGCRGGGGGGGGGVPDQFRHYIASRSSISLPISFPHHGVAAVVSSRSPPPPLAPTFAAAAAGFESYPPAALFPPLPPPSHHSHHYQHQHHRSGLQSATSVSNKTTHDDVKEEASSRLLTANLVLERERSIPVPSDHSIDEASWTNDEVLALLRIRSSMENWFPDFTWEHVSRKLAEVGFQRSAEKCKEKFEEESRNFSSMSYNKSTNYTRFFVSSDLDELYHDENPQASSSEKAPDNNMAAKENEKEVVEQENNIIGAAAAAKLQAACDQEKRTTLICRKRKRAEEEFEMFKGFCEAIVRKIIAQQEELHNKLIEDMIRRDEESIAREEAWKNQEIDRINKEMETRAREQAVAGDRQAKIIEFLKKFTSEFSQEQNLFLIKNKFQDLLKLTTNPSNSATAAEILTSSINVTSEQPVVIINNPTSSSTENTPSPHHHQYRYDNGCSTPKETSTSKNPNDSTTTENSSRVPAVAAASAPKFSLQMDEKGERDTGKRWPRDEVLALINLRCSLNNNSSSNEDNKDGSSKGPLWERISQMMSELGYQRSAKRCKEKWENINKYFRKTKDNKKKRSMDSRTCPYFHQLSNLYSQAGTLVGPSVVPENH